MKLYSIPQRIHRPGIGMPEKSA